MLRSLMATKCAEIWHGPIQTDQLQQALDKTCRLPKRQAKQNLYTQTSLDCRIDELALPPTLAALGRGLRHLRIKPDRQRSASLQRFIVKRPVLGLVLHRGPTAHDRLLSFWIHKMNPLRRFVQQSHAAKRRRVPRSRLGNEEGCKTTKEMHRPKNSGV